MSCSTSIPALIRYAIDYGYEGAALSAFVKQRYQENLEDLHEEEERRKQRYQENLEDLHEEEERRRLDEEERLNELQWEEEIKLKERKWAIEARFYEFERSEWGSIETTEKQEDEMLKDASISIAERIIIFKERIKRMTETKARLQIAEQAMLEQLKNMIIEPEPTPATTPDTPTLPDIQNHDATLSHKRDLIKITSPAPTESSINTTPDAPVDLNYTARQEPKRQNNKPTTVSLIGPIGLHTKPYQPLANGKKFADERRIALGPKPRPPTHTLMKQWSKDTGLSYRETCRLLYSCCTVVYPSLITGASPFATHPILSFDKSLNIT
ncbi:Golgi resident protein GCP60-like [Physella acuta]|uniref:Golgi resident protein GCP60-like n=1 Tax=Physella acuta TaxID=109671 RepID=UPI0027DE1F6B|nr:Golgi resident protein GCP60-like [Physella acuta]